MLLPYQSRMIELAKFTYSPLEKSFEKQIKTIEYQQEKQIKALNEHVKDLVNSAGEKDPLKRLKLKETFDELF